MPMKNLKSLLEHEVRDLLSAEKQLVSALPKLAKAASSQELKAAFESHLEQTRGHVQRLEQVCKELGIAARGEKCEAMAGLIKEGSQFLEQDGADPAVKDAALIASAQRVEHYEMAAYGCARAFAQQLKMDQVVELLEQTLDEEAAADEHLSEIAEGVVNPRAAEGVGA